jgi:hypothetical protein
MRAFAELYYCVETKHSHMDKPSFSIPQGYGDKEIAELVLDLVQKLIM